VWAMGVLLLAIGAAAQQQLFAPQPVAPAQYTTNQVGGFLAPVSASAAPPVFVGSEPVYAESASGSSFLAGAAVVAGVAGGLATLATLGQKKSGPKVMMEDPVPDLELWRMPQEAYEQWMQETDEQKKIAMLAAAGEFVPDMQRRTILNVILLAGAAVPVGWLGGGFIYFFVPPSKGGGGAGLVAKDALGDDVTKDGWAAKHPAGDRALVQGLKGDAHYLIQEADGSGLRNYALNAVCTHLGCVVPWNRAANKFMCPCHGSQYDETGKVVRGPAPLSLALAHLDINDTGRVVLSPWTETDFRTNTPPWWKA